MKVFISWSGSNSKIYAEALRNWLPSVLQLVKPYFTPSDVEKGTRWNKDIAKELEESQIGILCITRDNIHSDWVMFEAGAISKSKDMHVCPILFGIQNTDLAGPLKQFQTTEFDEDDFKKLINLINSKLGEHKLSLKVLDSVFEKWWPELEAVVKHTLEQSTAPDDEPIRSDRDLLEEVLETNRSIMRKVSRSPNQIAPTAIEDILRHYVLLHDQQANSEGSYQDALNILEEMKKALEYIAARFRHRSPALDELVERFLALEFVCKEKKDSIPEDDIPF